MSNDLNWISAAKLAKLFAKGKLSPVEAAKASFAQMAKLEPTLNAMSLIDEKATLKQARNSEQRWRKGQALSPLDGVDRKSTRLNSSHPRLSRMPSSA